MSAGWVEAARTRLDAATEGMSPEARATYLGPGSLTASFHRALDALDAVLALHAADEFGQCRICVAYEGYEGTTMEPWPCRTARTIEGDA